ncbi:MAG: class Ia ribonucleoside-diphosphate reductase subunit beta [Francisellaceae bacterium]
MNKPFQTFHTLANDPRCEPMFLGNPVNVSRFDQQKHIIFEKLTEKQLSFFWRPEEVDLSRDRIDFANLNEAQRHIFLSNLKYQTLLDSIQGRSPNIALLPLVSLPELETWIETWSFFETIHSRSYTHMVRSLMDQPAAIFDHIVDNREIQKRAKDISGFYDDLILKTQRYQSGSANTTEDRYRLKKALYLALHAVNALEAIRFYVSFACTFAFSESKRLEGCGKIMKLIARDEALHLTATQHMIRLIDESGDGDDELTEIAKDTKEEAKAIFVDAIAQEKEWACYLFQHGSMLGLNKTILCQYIDYLAKERMQTLGFSYDHPEIPADNPIPWINTYLASDHVQVAPQETEISTYLTGQIKSEIDPDAFERFEL